jgi:hypothetical protein
MLAHFKKDGAKRHPQIFNFQSSIFNSGLSGLRHAFQHDKHVLAQAAEQFFQKRRKIRQAESDKKKSNPDFQWHRNDKNIHLRHRTCNQTEGDAGNQQGRNDRGPHLNCDNEHITAQLNELLH